VIVSPFFSANRTDYLAALLRHHGVAGFCRGCRLNYRFPAQDYPFHSGRIVVRKLVFCDAKTARADCPDMPVVVFWWWREAESFDKFLDPGEFKTLVPVQNETGDVFSTPQARRERPRGGGALASEPHLGGGRRGLRDRIYPASGYLVASAALSYECTCAVQVGLRCTCHHRAAAASLMRVHTSKLLDAITWSWLTAVPPMIAMMLRED